MTELTMVPVAPFGTLLDRDAIREVWKVFVVPGQQSGTPQSVEERYLMAALRTLYHSLPPTEREPDVTEGKG